MKAIVLGVAVLSLVVGCGEKHSPTVRTDVTPITRRLPNLGSIQAVAWQSVRTDKDSFLSPPAHPAYRVWGIAQLEKTKADEFAHNYEWQKMPANWKPDMTLTNASLKLSDWNRSAAFTKDCKPQQLLGELFFDRSNGAVFFDIQRGE
jgi:hypothetical protein